MVRLNKNKLSEDRLRDLFLQLNKILGKLHTKQIELFLLELLGPEEHIMLAKRFATIIMIHEGYSLYKIGNSLKVSPTTAQKIKYKYKKGDYSKIIKNAKSNKADYELIWEVLDSILTVGGIMPHYGHVRLQK